MIRAGRIENFVSEFRLKITRRKKMKLSKLLKRLSSICFLLMWIPFAMVMINGPLSMASGNLSDIEAAGDIFSSPWMYAMGALFAGTFIFFIGSMVVGGLANKRVIAKGQDAEAKILSITDTGTRINDNPVVDFSLQVQPANFPAFIAQARQTVSMIHLPSLQPGKSVYVKYVPGNDHVAIVGVKQN